MSSGKLAKRSSDMTAEFYLPPTDPEGYPAALPKVFQHPARRRWLSRHLSGNRSPCGFAAL